jgi:hypothetical protein
VTLCRSALLPVSYAVVLYDRVNDLKPPVTKADLRRELDRQIDAYLREGGQVQEIPRGISGREPSDGPLPAAPFCGGENKEKRAYLTDVIAAIEARRKPPAAIKTKPRRPRKKFIYDDFGEPVRWVWEE